MLPKHARYQTALYPVVRDYEASVPKMHARKIAGMSSRSGHTDIVTAVHTKLTTPKPTALTTVVVIANARNTSSHGIELVSLRKAL